MQLKNRVIANISNGLRIAAIIVIFVTIAVVLVDFVVMTACEFFLFLFHLVS